MNFAKQNFISWTKIHPFFNSETLLFWSAWEHFWKPMHACITGVFTQSNFCLQYLQSGRIFFFLFCQAQPSPSSSIITLEQSTRPPVHPTGASIRTAFYSKTTLVKLVLLAELILFGRQHQFVRRPHFFFLWKTTSIFFYKWKTTEIGKWQHLFSIWKTTTIFLKLKATSIVFHL